MADQLATVADLTKLVAVDSDTATLLLELATAKVQRAAGGQRLVDLTDTAVLDITDLDEWLVLPQRPARSVASVVLDGTTITDWKLVDQKLWRLLGWLTSWAQPSQVQVTYSHGYLDGAQDLQLARDMTLSLAKLGAGNPSGATSEAIDDYKVTYAEADARMQLSEFQQLAIADAYGASAYTTGSY